PSHAHRRALPSFPTRRSSDLALGCLLPLTRAIPSVNTGVPLFGITKSKGYPLVSFNMTVSGMFQTVSNPSPFATLLYIISGLAVYSLVLASNFLSHSYPSFGSWVSL